jgi:hypothetical protein
MSLILAMKVQAVELSSDFSQSFAILRQIEQPVVWKFCADVVTHPGIPT